MFQKQYISINYMLNNLNDSYKPIIDPKKYNGRVNIISQPDPDAAFRLQERIGIKNNATEYRSALSGNDWESNVIAQVYFSQGNIQIIQNGLRAGVYEMSNRKIVVPPQNLDQLKIIMRSIYFQHVENCRDNITQQVERLNHLVLEYAVPAVYNEAVGYLKYMQDQSTLVMPMDYPIHHDRQYKQLKMKAWF
jgi:hypothetical protein